LQALGEGTIGADVSVRRLFAIFVALSVLFAPAAASAAMSASHHDMPMIEAGHCGPAPSNSADHDKMAGKTCCIAMCMALAVAPSTPGEAMPQRQQVTQFAAPRTYHGLPAEIATPPPRSA
jgi:hypothetical protein